ncbi:MAG: hypothetical protein A2X61_13605 [Ignavibacteria bacterium GWB2_35_12]|nr:MAG: hypothetical protein A2X61_13605 [Ignavibacteria bacterium GWB2_35_12]OGU95205.1 MAG: hypothetical protein A2220_00305 [Ignavibacteria bacterium RIFOXYA2_FULL_35_10]OGV24503.1 MAG: hypothetical protein A2475_15470 [Ignavibacteria bacterium RIFOXYC2_FULL_35_21]
MATRLDELRMVDPVLTTIAQGYSNASMVAEYLFPSVQVSKLKGKIPMFGKEAFVLRQTERAIRAASNRIPPSDLELVSFETHEEDIEIALDYLEEEESPDFYRLEQRIAKELMDILLLGKEKEAADLVQNPSNFEAGLKTVVEAGTAWDDYTLTDVDPILVIKEAMSSIRSRIAVYPNTMVIGDSTYQALMQHPKLLDRVKYAGVSKVTRQVLAEITEIPNIHVGMSVYSTDGSSFTDVWGDNVVLAYVDAKDRNSRSEFNPSYGYTFQREGKPEVDTYFENGGKIKVIRNTDNYCIKVTASDAAFLISNTNHL